MFGVFEAVRQGLCWVLSVPPEALAKVLNVVKAVVCGGGPTA